MDDEAALSQVAAEEATPQDRVLRSSLPYKKVKNVDQPTW